MNTSARWMMPKQHCETLIDLAHELADDVEQTVADLDIEPVGDFREFDRRFRTGCSNYQELVDRLPSEDSLACSCSNRRVAFDQEGCHRQWIARWILQEAVRDVALDCYRRLRLAQPTG